MATSFLVVGLWYLWSSFKLNDVNGFRGLTQRNYLNIGVTALAFVVYAAILQPLGFIALERTDRRGLKLVLRRAPLAEHPAGVASACRP